MFFYLDSACRVKSQDHVILPRDVTDSFYSTVTRCYEDMFEMSFSPKYTLNVDDNRISKKASTKSTKEKESEIATGQDIIKVDNGSYKRHVNDTLNKTKTNQRSNHSRLFDIRQQLDRHNCVKLFGTLPNKKGCYKVS